MAITHKENEPLPSNSLIQDTKNNKNEQIEKKHNHALRTLLTNDANRRESSATQEKLKRTKSTKIIKALELYMVNSTTIPIKSAYQENRHQQCTYRIERAKQK